MNEAKRNNDRKLVSSGNADEGRNDRAVNVRGVMRNAGLSPEHLAELPFDQAVELLSRAGIEAELSDDQAITLVGFLLSSRRHG